MFIFLSMFLESEVPAQDDSSAVWKYVLPIEVKKSVESGRQNPMSHFCGASVELALPGVGGIFSKKQMEVILSEFLAKHPKMTLSIDYEEAVGESTISVGKLVRNGESFRIYVTTKPMGGVHQIKQIRIEELK